MTSQYFQTLFSEITKKCLENDITDYKTCYEFHKFKKNDLLLEGIKDRYDMMESFKPVIKDCIDNNKNKTECYYSKKNKFEYTFPVGYANEFYHIYDKMYNKMNKN
jgi:hypothetical protein